ncbi:unnamed protein product [Chilo suppressalis]|uniref:peptidylamidoglycolate lyase n=1 Tax=Chilo suppressalis TaxID=168631 RepID=A0ABN8B889_CHISP|nr:unnamed protein product [Chilo suppressalis]
MSYLRYFTDIIYVALFFSNIPTFHARRVQYQDYYGNNYNQNLGLESMINTALGKLDHSLQWMKEWPEPVKLGQVSGVALDGASHVLVFHRATNVWDATTFSERNVYQSIGEPPISQPTILVFNETGELIDMWGKNLFYIPHGITVDSNGNVWVTDVALHQVFKFTPDQKDKPALVLGEKFIPGNDDEHFCKPTSVAVMANGDFFVADGYCNHRILKFSPQGEIILQWGKAHGLDHFSLNVPHALTLAEDRGTVCVADRERGRVACFRADNGTYAHSYAHELIGSRLFSVAYSPALGGRLYVVNGPYGTVPVPVRGYVIEYDSGRLVGTFAPDGGLRNPHDVAVSPDGRDVYVVELDPYKVRKFVNATVREDQDRSNVSVVVKPTATVEGAQSVVAGLEGSVVPGGVGQAGDAPAWWWWGAGGAVGCAGAALLALAAAALLRARNHGERAPDTATLLPHPHR